MCAIVPGVANAPYHELFKERERERMVVQEWCLCLVSLVHCTWHLGRHGVNTT